MKGLCLTESPYNWEIVEGIMKIMEHVVRTRQPNEFGEKFSCFRGEGVIAKDIYDYVKEHKEEIK